MTPITANSEQNPGIITFPLL